MILGVMSDTHEDKNNVIPHIIKQFKARGVQRIIHSGDIVPKHVLAELFGNLPVVCALVDNQVDPLKIDPAFTTNIPPGWMFTTPGKRVFTLPDGTLVYNGHRRHMDFLTASEEKFNAILMALRGEFDGLRYVFGGHLHFQTFKQGQLVSFINPGAVADAIGWGYEYAIVDTETNEVIFSRILPAPDDRQTFSVGVISDSADISHRDAHFWERLVHEFERRDVRHIIHCGNIDLDDIGRPELKNMSVHYAIRKEQLFAHQNMKKDKDRIPENWHVISEEKLDDGAVVDINGFRFFVQWDLGLKFMSDSEASMDSKAMQIMRAYPGTEFVLCGFTREALFVEGQKAIIINPGDINISRNFAVICLPRREVTFGHVPYDALPEYSQC